MLSLEEKGNVQNMDTYPGIFSLGNKMLCLHEVYYEYHAYYPEISNA